MITTDQGLVLPDATDNRNVPLSVSDYNTGVESRLVKRYASTADRTLRNPSPTENELSGLADLNRFEYYTGSQWLPLVPRPTDASVATSQTTTSTAYTDLATAGPAVTVATDTQALVTVTATFSLINANGAYMGFAVSGATTIAAADNRAIIVGSTVAFRYSGTYLVTGLTPGSNTFTAKYRVLAGGTGTFLDRNIIVTPA